MFLFGVVAIQPFDNVSKIIVVTGILGGLWTILFIFTQRWDLRVVDIDFVNGVIEKWERIRPAGLETFIQNEDILGGVLAIFAPLLVSVLILRRKYERFFGSILTPVILGVILFGVFISGSRPAWAGMLVSALFYVFLFFAFFANQRVRKWAAILSSFIFVSLLIVVGLSNYQESSVFLGKTISNIPSLKERQFLYQQMEYLVQDFFFTGGGLAAFPGLYSRYILKIPNLYLSYGHQFYLDLWLELGFLGLMGFMIIVVRSLGAGLKGYLSDEDAARGIFRIAILSGWAGLLFSGFYEDAVFGLKGTVILLFLPGLMVAINRDLQQENPKIESETILAKQEPRSRIILGVGLLIAIGIILSVARNDLLSNWYANLGAVGLAKEGLAGWPEQAPGEFDSINTDSAENYFEKALQLDPENFTANYRQGIIAFRKQDFEIAKNYLEKAFRKEPDNVGVLKYLAYSYAWSGDEARAYELFKKTPGAKQELQIYGGWLKSINRDELSETAFSLAEQLQ